MKNIKGIAMVTDGNLKRIAITFDEIADDGTIKGVNLRVNKIVVDEDAKKAIAQIETFAQKIVDEQEG